MLSLCFCLKSVKLDNFVFPLISMEMGRFLMSKKEEQLSHKRTGGT
jgi:hypothetical protein